MEGFRGNFNAFGTARRREVEPPAKCRPAVARLSMARQFPFRNGTGIGGADRDQTDDLVVANDALYQLSYCPMEEGKLVKDGFGRVKQIFPVTVSR